MTRLFGNTTALAKSSGLSAGNDAPSIQSFQHIKDHLLYSEARVWAIGQTFFQCQPRANLRTIA